MRKKVLVGMSGGVDSSMCAFLLLQNGFEPSGVNCRFFDDEDIVVKGKSCCSPEEANDAKLIAEKLGIDFCFLDFKNEFRSRVMDNFAQTYVKGATPNPCVECNRHLKFGKMLDYAIERGFDYVATGHYAIIEFDEKSGRYLLKKGKDTSKDQSYVLYGLTQHQLAHTLFPLGKFCKTEIRQTAEEQGFANAKKHDSQDICFVPDGDYASFIEKHCGKTFPDGNFVDENGKFLGTHKGIIRYTIGQHRGLGLGGLPAPLFVLEKNIEKNEVVLAPNDKLFSDNLDAEDINLISVERLDAPMRVKAKVRYKQPEQWATITQTDENHIHVVFDEPQRAFAKGQAVVFYDGDYVVGGGKIM